MNRTEKLFTIFVILLVSFTIYIFYIKRNEIKEFWNDTISRFKEGEVNPPYEKTVNHRTYTYKTVKETKDFKPNNINDIKNIIYTVLNNGWEEFSFYCPKKYENCINDVKLLVKDKYFLPLMNNYVNPYNEYKNFNTSIINESEVHVSINKLYTDEDKIKINNKIKQILTELNIKKYDYSLNDIKNIHDYLIKYIEYDTEYDDIKIDTPNTAIGALINKKAICSGYADALALILDELNIPNFKVSSEDHIWNVIKFNNEWKHIDLTWDDDEHNKNNYYNFYYISTKELLEKDKEFHSFNQELYLELK